MTVGRLRGMSGSRGTQRGSSKEKEQMSVREEQTTEQEEEQMGDEPSQGESEVFQDTDSIAMRLRELPSRNLVSRIQTPDSTPDSFHEAEASQEARLPTSPAPENVPLPSSDEGS